MTAKLSQEEYRDRVNCLGVTVLGEYQGRKTPILHLCRCGKEWVAPPDNVLAGQKCANCKREQMQVKFTKPKINYENELQQLGIKLIGDYINARKKTDHICVCGREFSARPQRVLHGDKCGICTKNKDKLIYHKDYLNQLAERKIKVTPLESYVNMRTKIKHRCVCGNDWSTKPPNVLNGWLCGCERSKGEVQVREWLDAYGFEYQQEYSFSDLKCRRLLRYDFALFQGNGLLCLVEFHGRQHFNYTKSGWFKSEEDFKEQQMRDKKKRDYAKRNDLKLIEIRFDQDVSDELDQLLGRGVLGG